MKHPLQQQEEEGGGREIAEERFNSHAAPRAWHSDSKGLTSEAEMPQGRPHVAGQKERSNSSLARGTAGSAPKYESTMASQRL